MFSLKEAKLITGGGLTKTTKMPCYSFSLPIESCVAGSRLRPLARSVCNNCYAGKGRAAFKNVFNARAARLRALQNPQWTDAMIELIRHYSSDYFRWFDAGDIQSEQMLHNIVTIATKLSTTKFWLPTQERRLVRQYQSKYIVPNNLLIRVSAPMINVPLASKQYPHVSMVAEKPNPFLGYICPATTIRNTCDDCRACWDRDIDSIIYKAH